MEKIKFDLNKKSGKFKILNATNGGPWHKRHADDQGRSNFDDYKAAKIPFSRNHDSAEQPVYGGPFCHDISAIFPNFDADPYDPDSYDFACTDEAVAISLEAGTQTFFRLGQSIEHQIKKHNTLPPKNFKKWAVVCEHIIRHCNEGWANGFRFNIEYWEIWNEADLDRDDSEDKRTWGGTKREYFELYEIAATHLKKCFPNLKIGGPALAYDEKWADEFLAFVSEKKLPLDFFSWHIYSTEPKWFKAKADRMHDLLVKYGLDDAKSILNEWNYIKGWSGEKFMYSVNSIHGIKNASFILACMCMAQHSSIDMLMYYDTRPSPFNGIFDYYTYKPLKGYYAFKWYGMFYDTSYETEAENSVENIYTLCGCDENGKAQAVVTYYTDDDKAGDKTVLLDFGRSGIYEIYKLNENYDGEHVEVTDDLTLKFSVYTCYLIKEI